MTLENQYKDFIKKNPNYSHWEFNEWLKFHSEKIGELIKEMKERDINILENLDDN